MSGKETLIRVYWVYFFVLILSGGIISRIFYLQFFEGSQLQLDAEKQIFVSKNISAPRGNIYASNEQKTSLALSVPRYRVYVDLMTIKEEVFNNNIQSLSDSLSLLLPQNSSEEWESLLVKQRKNGNRYYFVARGLNN